MSQEPLHRWPQSTSAAQALPPVPSESSRNLLNVSSSGRSRPPHCGRAATAHLNTSQRFSNSATTSMIVNRTTGSRVVVIPRASRSSDRSFQCLSASSRAVRLASVTDQKHHKSRIHEPSHRAFFGHHSGKRRRQRAGSGIPVRGLCTCDRSSCRTYARRVSPSAAHLFGCLVLPPIDDSLSHLISDIPSD
ncbi:hypothetical protein SAMN06264855_1034 [Halorubrum vacuolatum]|uniref:Uncharacterized protein n=1 Tax=Halorubrum vacuolatum TaxID=63740 RepID=A0A238VJZ8_HALVU|nr:hypothetical protein SAMN06264855_1034 [Halorubrum vacuolatum]